MIAVMTTVTMKKEKPPEEFTVRCDIYETFLRTSPHLFGMFLTTPMRTHHVRTGNIQVLENCPNLTSVNFFYCEKIEGEHTSNAIS